MKKAQFQEPDAAEVRALLSAMIGRRVTVVGDAMLDHYFHGKVGRISPEAPVPVFEIQNEERLLGGAANVARCLVALGAKVSLVALIGDDTDGALLLEEAKDLGIDTSGVVIDKSRPTTIKSRVVARHQQMLRLDREDSKAPDTALSKKLAAALKKSGAKAEAIILSDYAKGVLTPEVCAVARDFARTKPVLADPKVLPWTNYRGLTLLKPNRPEAQTFAGGPIKDVESAQKAAAKLARELKLKHALITLGEQGMVLDQGKNGSLHLPARVREVFDTTGAGDVVAAFLTLTLAAGGTPAQAAWLANLAAGIKVGKFGAASVSDAEILEAVGEGAPVYERKLMTRQQAAAQAAEWRKQGRQVVFTNGCFDILHLGHVNYLERSRRLGDALIVGVNSDASVKRLKGPGRPVQIEHDRARIIASQACVDAVVVFDEDTPLELIRAIKPQVLCKGADYKHKKNVVGWDLVEKWGGKVALVELVQGRSTTSLIEKSKTH